MLGIIINYFPKDNGLSINDIANIIIAGVNLVLAFYIFIYQKNKDKKSDYSTSLLNEKNINLQWFKDIIIQPHLKILLDNFEELINWDIDFVSNNDPNYDEKVNDYLELLKSNLYPIRRNFISLFEVADSRLFKNSIAALDLLVDDITIKLIDNRIDVIQPDVYEMFVTKEIINTKNKLIKLIYSFKG